MVAVVVQVGHQLLARLLDQLPGQRKVPDGCIRLLSQVQAALVPAHQPSVSGNERVRLRARHARHVLQPAGWCSKAGLCAWLSRAGRWLCNMRVGT